MFDENTALVWLTITSILMYVGPALASAYFVLTTPNSAEAGADQRSPLEPFALEDLSVDRKRAA